MSIADNNERIARNTVILYARMIVVTIVTLYSSRVVLRNLGVSDFGVFNILGGIIGMLGYVNTLLSGAVSRFLTFDLGTGDMEELKRTFRLSNFLCLLSVLLFFLLGETVGLWFVDTHLNIDPSRMQAAKWVYQCALISAATVVLQSPFSASMIAHERMSVYAIVCVTDAVLKLAAAIALAYCGSDRLIAYGSMLVAVSLIDFLIYLIFGLKDYDECSLKLYFEKKKFKEMFSYSGWNMVMVFANMLNLYGLNILLNVFYGTIVNAARGLALQINALFTMIYSNFQTAALPQITKYYAQGEKEQMQNLICNTSKFSPLLLLPIIIPICFNAEGLLRLWLGDVPEHTADFVIIMAVISIFSAIDLPVGMGIHAVGRMKLPNLTAALVYLSVFPITYAFMKSGASAVAGYIVFVTATPLILCIDLMILRKYSGFSIRIFIKSAMRPFAFIILPSLSLPFIINALYTADSAVAVIFKSIIDAVFVAVTVFFLAVPKDIRRKTMERARKKFSRGQ